MRQEETQHILDDKLELYSMGRIPEEELDQLEDHLLVCAHCQDRLAEAQEYTRIMKTATARLERQPSPQAVPFWQKLFASPHPVWAAAVAMALALVFILPFRDEAPEVVQLAAMRGEETNVARAAAERPLELRLAAETVPAATSYIIEIVRNSGETVWQGQATRPDGIIFVSVPEKLDRGRYWVRIYDSPSKAELLREYALELE
jgi:hypothetical protein